VTAGPERPAGRRDTRLDRRSWSGSLLIVVLILALDQVTKALAVAFLEKSPVDLGVVRLAVSRNSGSAFSLFKGQVWLFLSATIVVTTVAALTVTRPHGRWTAVGLALIVGGAWSNVIDRFLRVPGAPNGRVVDFIDFKVWPVFNLADSAIVIGAGLLLLFGGRSRDRARGL
jgi:signal peptidase II